MCIIERKYRNVFYCIQNLIHFFCTFTPNWKVILHQKKLKNTAKYNLSDVITTFNALYCTSDIYRIHRELWAWLKYCGTRKGWQQQECLVIVLNDPPLFAAMDDWLLFLNVFNTFTKKVHFLVLTFLYFIHYFLNTTEMLQAYFHMLWCVRFIVFMNVSDTSHSILYYFY